MKIVIAGAGEVGSHLAKMLSGGIHDITVIDSDQRLLDSLGDMGDIITIEGNATTFATLKKAMVRKADLFIGVTQIESTNIISAMLAKQLGAKKSIARIDNNEYLEPNNKEIFINMGIDYLFYPEIAAAEEIIDLLGHASISEYFDFSGGRLAMIVYKLDDSSPLLGKTLLEATVDRKHLHYRTVAIARDGQTIIPRGDDEFMLNDNVYVIVDRQSLKHVMEYSGKKSIDIKSLIIIGGSRVGIHVAARLQDTVNVKLVEYDQDKAYKLAELLDNTLIIHEDGRNIDALIEEGLPTADALVAVTEIPESNILIAMLAKRIGVKKVIAEVKNLNYINLAENIGVDTIINKKLITASNIFRFTMRTDVQAVKYLTGSDAKVLEFIVRPNSPATKQQIKDLGFPKDAIIGGIVRGDKVLIAVGDTEINSYDRVVVFALPDAIDKIGHFFN